MSDPNQARSSKSPRPTKVGRLIFIDDNIDRVGGHYFELGGLLMQAAKQSGHAPILVTHADLKLAGGASSTSVLPMFKTRRMVRWSLGEDGRSSLVRDARGRSIGGSLVQRVKQKITDALDSPSKRPQAMLDQWSKDFCEAMEVIKPTRHDSLMINTGDDFVLLALANAIERRPLPGVRIDMVFHFSLDDQQNQARLGRIGEQTRSAIKRIGSDRLFLHATTKPLAQQWKQADIAKNVRVIPYPTRKREIKASETQTGEPIKAVFAGSPRAEKGREAFQDLLTQINETHLKEGRFRVSLQIPENRSKSMIPTCLQAAYEHALAGRSGGPIEVKSEALSTRAYHDWLDTADLGLFLYDPNRYAVRCSGVLLELLSRGVPVIVPDHCWLADQVRLAGGHRSIGFIYQNRDEIPDLMRQFAKHRTAMSCRAIEHAHRVQATHDATNTLGVMGVIKRHVAREAA